MARHLRRIAIFEAVLVFGLGIALLLRDSDPEIHLGETRSSSPKFGATATPRRGDEAAPHSNPTPIESSPAEETVSTDDPVGLVVYGTVSEQGESDHNLSSYFVRCTRLDQKESGRKFSNNRGQPFSFAGVAPGHYRLTCRSNGFIQWRRELELPATPRVQRIDIQLRRKIAIQVSIVTRAGDRSTDRHWFERHAFIATDSPPPDRIPVDDEGTPRIPLLGEWQPKLGQNLTGAAGEVLLSQSPPISISALIGPLVLQTVRVETGQREAKFTIDSNRLDEMTASLRVRFSDAKTGQPLSSAFVRIGQSGVSANRKGEYRLARMSPGTYDVAVFTKGTHEYFTRAIELKAGDNIDLGTIALKAGAKCTGQIVDASGKGAKAYVIGYSLEGGNPRWPLVRGPATGTAPDGTFALKGCRSGRNLIRAVARNPDREAYVVLPDIPPSSPPQLTLKPTIPVRIDSGVLADGQITIVFRTAAGDPIHCQRIESTTKHGPRLLPGVYDVDIFGPNGRRQVRLTVEKDSPTLEVR